MCIRSVMPLFSFIFSSLRIKVSNLYHMPGFFIESVKETDLCFLNGEGRKQSFHWHALSSSIWGKLCALSKCYCGQHRDQKFEPHVFKLAVYRSIVHLILFRMMSLYKHLKNLSYSKYLALETNYI